MPSSRELWRAPKNVQDVATRPPHVNNSRISGGAPPAAGATVRRFTPHHHLAALSADPRQLALSPAARTVLGIALWRAGKTGEGEGTGPGEAMFVRRLATHDRARTAQNTLCADARMSKWAVRQAIAELAAARLVRVLFVRPLQRLPRLPGGAGGQRVAETVAVFYVDIARLRGLLDVGTERANGAVTQPLGGLCGSTVTPAKSRVFGAPAVKTPTDQVTGNAVVNQEDLTGTTNHRGTPPNPPPGGDGSKDIPPELAGDVERVFATWWRLIGRRRQHSIAPPPRTVRSVQSAIAAALVEGYSVADLEAAIGARADRAIGGAAFDFCEAPPAHPDRPIWAAGIFGGSLDKLLAFANAHAERQRSRALAASASEREAAGGSEGSELPTRSRGVQTAAEDLRALLGVDPTPAWLNGRQGARVIDGDRAAFRPPRR